MNRFAILAIVVCSLIAGFVARGWAPHFGAAAHHDENKEHGEEGQGEHNEHKEEPHVPLTREAVDSLRLRLESVSIKPYQQTSIVPAEVVEFPGVSARQLTAPVSGEVVAIGAQLGATVLPGDVLIEIRITDERVIEAQLQLVEAMTRLAIIDKELRRIEPLTASGAVRGRQRLDLEYKREQLTTTLSLKRDELQVRGMTLDQVEQLVSSKQLLRTLAIKAPGRGPGRADQVSTAEPAVRPVAWKEGSPETDLSVERLSVQPGETVKRGQLLCELASHQRLYLKGHAFEADLPLVVGLAKQQHSFSAEFGHSQSEHRTNSVVRSGLKLRYVANEVEPESRAYPFYVPLDNELLHESTDENGYRYRTWRFTVGQRAHLMLPTTSIDGQIPLPVEAVAIDGPNAFVFVPCVEEEPDDHAHDHGHEHADGHDHDHGHHHEEEHDHEEHGDEIIIELEPIPVTVLHRDSQGVVIAVGGQLKEGDTVAMNAAYQLYQALHDDAGGGQGHDHGHQH